MQTALTILGLVGFFFVVSLATPPSYMDYESMDDGVERDDRGERIVYGIQVKRGCVPRGGNCDHRAADCCYSTACRCNLWGANCRCQRKGLFTKLG
ncbi:U8-agatoxin-Ao1a-like [Cimex lectularius]|uniref:Uncharacterized protein n=1 Tax=Cimex lectularius TaxID=79782 RepID=A0A8I6S2I5_CIMLE|nr:U8-agatoxin-Ao1a-like [Cimex lectularius]